MKLTTLLGTEVTVAFIFLLRHPGILLTTGSQLWESMLPPVDSIQWQKWWLIVILSVTTSAKAARSAEEKGFLREQEPEPKCKGVQGVGRRQWGEREKRGEKREGGRVEALLTSKAEQICIDKIDVHEWPKGTYDGLGAGIRLYSSVSHYLKISPSSQSIRDS